MRIGTAEIYRQVERIDAVLESLVIGQNWPPGAYGDVRVVLFVRLRDGVVLDRSTLAGWVDKGDALIDPLVAAVRRYVMATWLWAGLFAARLAVQVPLLLDDAVGWLGTAKLLMGVPLFAVVIWLTWLMVREPEELREPASAGSPPGTPPH